MRYGSVCSGIEAASVAWEPLGWKPKWFCEIEPFCCRLLHTRYRHVSNLGDITRVNEHTQNFDDIDLLVGGTPCQSFSLQGKRRGLKDTRGNLALHFLRLASIKKPRWVVWENVTGVLSNDSGETFRCILEQLAKCGYGVAYRVLDSRHFGVPQQRRRVFVVGHLGDWRAAASVLFEQAQLLTNAKAGRTVSDAAENENTRSLSSSTEVPGSVLGWSGDETTKVVVECLPTIKSQQGGEGTGVCFLDGRNTPLRRLTTNEFERAMGFPVGYTEIEKGEDTRSRHKALGNSMVVPIMRWLGQRISAVERREFSDAEPPLLLPKKEKGSAVARIRITEEQKKAVVDTYNKGKGGLTYADVDSQLSLPRGTSSRILRNQDKPMSALPDEVRQVIQKAIDDKQAEIDVLKKHLAV